MAKDNVPKHYKGIMILNELSDNYQIWESDVSCILKGADVFEVCTRAVVTKEDSTLYKSTYYKAMSEIRKYIGGTVKLRCVDLSQDPKDLWEGISKMFQNKTSGSKILSLQNMMQARSSQFTTLKEYVNNMRVLKLQCMQMGWKVEDALYSLTLLMGLDGENPNHVSIRTHLLTKAEDINFEDAADQIILGDNLANYNGETDMGLFVQTYKTKKFTKKKKGKLICFYCEQAGHPEFLCKKKKADEKAAKMSFKDFA